MSRIRVFFLPDYPINYFSKFSVVDIPTLKKMIKDANKTHCLNDPFDIRKVDLDKMLSGLAETYALIINSSLTSGVFPSSEKIAYVRPLKKSGKSANEISSYRPVSNLSFLSKLLEKCVLDQLLDHMNNFESIPKFQSAYRKFHSVETAICRIYNDLLINKCNNKCSMLILLDQTAAFDTVDHSLLLRDLEHFGVTGTALAWLKSYLTNRTFRVVIDDVTSEPANLESSVPQGSNLGPFLYSIYTIELYHLLLYYNVSCHFYADDTQIYIVVSDMESTSVHLNAILEVVNKWMQKKRLKLNTNKTDVILVGTNCGLREFEDIASINILGTNVTLSKAVRNLGVFLDSNLSFDEHIRRTKKKAIGNLINIAHIAKYIDKDTRTKLIHNLVFSTIDFCNSVLYGLPDYKLHGLQIIINNSARLIMGIPRFSRERITPICIDLHFLPIKARIIYKICLMTFKALTFGQPVYLNELLHIYRPNTNVALRHTSEPLRLTETRMSMSLCENRSFQYCAPRLFNQIPPHVRSQNSVDSFKRQLKTWLFSRCYNLSTQEITPIFSC